jgi:hypothetical protein
MFVASLGDIFSLVHDHFIPIAWVTTYLSCIICMIKRRNAQRAFVYGCICSLTALMSFFNIGIAAVMFAAHESIPRKGQFGHPPSLHATADVVFALISVAIYFWSITNIERPEKLMVE